MLTREPCGVPPLSGLGLRKEPVREYCTRKIVCVGRQSWNPCEMGERKRRGTPVWFYILRPFSFSDCTWMLGLHQDCNRIVDCSLCLLWLHCDVEIKPGLHGAGKSTVFECLALAEFWVLHRDCRITMDCRTFAILFLVLLSFR